MKTTRLIIVGGFLGAGKTTLLFATTKLLMQRGQRVGLITNDQASGLVDTAWLQYASENVAELSGSCFCCNYDAFFHATQQLQAEAQADIILAEPVGSCTDLSATIMQPLKANANLELIISPLTVLADPLRLANILEGGNARLHPSSAYIYRKQLEESDIILISKTDWFTESQVKGLIEQVQFNFPKQLVMAVSAKTGKGIPDWLQVLEKSKLTGGNIVELDYDRYAEGEAVLGWLNASISLQGKNIDWEKFAHDFLTCIGQKADQLNAPVGHIKIILESGTECLLGNLTGTIETLNITGNAGIGNECSLIVNARAELSPELLERLVKESLDETTGHAISREVKTWQCLRPGYPSPTHRFTSIVNQL